MSCPPTPDRGIPRQTPPARRGILFPPATRPTDRPALEQAYRDARMPITDRDNLRGFAGRIVWHTEWWHYTGEVCRAKTMGPRIEQAVADIIGNEYAGIPAPDIIGGIKSAFIQRAREHLGLLETDQTP